MYVLCLCMYMCIYMILDFGLVALRRAVLRSRGRTGPGAASHRQSMPLPPTHLMNAPPSLPRDAPATIPALAVLTPSCTPSTLTLYLSPYTGVSVCMFPFFPLTYMSLFLWLSHLRTMFIRVCCYACVLSYSVFVLPSGIPRHLVAAPSLT